MACSAHMHRNAPQSQPFICCGFTLPSGPLLQGPSLADIRQHATDTRLQLFRMPPCRKAPHTATAPSSKPSASRIACRSLPSSCASSV